MKKTPARCLCILLMLGLFTGCSGQKYLSADRDEISADLDNWLRARGYALEQVKTYTREGQTELETTQYSVSLSDGHFDADWITASPAVFVDEEKKSGHAVEVTVLGASRPNVLSVFKQAIAIVAPEQDPQELVDELLQLKPKGKTDTVYWRVDGLEYRYSKSGETDILSVSSARSYLRFAGQ